MILTLTKVVFPVPPSPTADRCEMQWRTERYRRERQEDKGDRNIDQKDEPQNVLASGKSDSKEGGITNQGQV